MCCFPGPVLGPLLFLMMYLSRCTVHRGCLISIFADNILMYLEIGCVEDYDLLQELLNVSKCKIHGNLQEESA